VAGGGWEEDEDEHDITVNVQTTDHSSCGGADNDRLRASDTLLFVRLH